MHVTRLLLIALLVPLAACEAERSILPLVEPVSGPSASLVLSHPNADVGDEVIVTATLRTGIEALVAGSFGADVRYDPSALRYLGEAPLDGALRVVNATAPGRVRIAGASPDGFTDGRLFAARFVVLRASGTGTLQLEITQLGTVGFRDELSRVTVQRHVAAELR